ncbi:MAG: hypothetical protein HGA97_03060, partial [Chlorobiaceae bacterium]|nr:hypothetical protein [Chlorobiaceae bacterium]
TAYKKCLIGGNSCPDAIDSHSVPLAALGSIANNGQVYTFKSPTHDELAEIYSSCKYYPKPLGIKKASTYHGFCPKHDDSIFSEIEKSEIKPSKKQVFLFHFRAYSRQLYLNLNSEKALKEIYNAKRPDNHKPKDALETIGSHFQPQRDAFSDLTENFESMKYMIDSDTVPILNHLFIRINCVPDIMCSTLFVPIYDIEGKFLLPLSKGNELDFCQAMSITISKDSVGGFLLLVWEGKDTLTSAFMRTFIKSGYDFNRLISVIFGNTENFFFNSHWWQSLDDERREILMYFASVTFLSQVDTARDHLQLMYHILISHQKIYVKWPILSTDYSAASDKELNI